jgi:hypothetical protein
MGSGSRLSIVSTHRDYPLKTKRLVVGQVTICRGCCCGDTERGRPAVPVEWLKNEWRARGLLKRVQLTISGCVGPCDVPNVVVITRPWGTEWLVLLRLNSIAVYWNGLSGVGTPARCWLCRLNFTGVESVLLFVRISLGSVEPPAGPTRRV